MSIGGRIAPIVLALVAIAAVVYGQGDDYEQDLTRADWAILPLKGSANTVDTENLGTLVQWIGDAEIVAFGEAPHGVSEFADLKIHIFKHLVQESDFSVFVIEANQAACGRIDEYINGAEGNPRELLDGLGNWLWNTQEMLDLVSWMREENQKRERKLHFAGIDMKLPGIAMDEVLEFLTEARPKLVAEVRNRYELYRKIPGMGIVPHVGGGLFLNLPVETLKGRNVKFSGWIRTQEVNRFASDGAGPGIWMVTETGYAYAPWLPGSDIPGSTPWTLYSVDLEVPDEAEVLRVGVTHRGNGTVWFDSLSLTAGGEPIEFNDFNLDFESTSLRGFSPIPARYAPLQQVDYDISVDDENAQSGTKSLRIVYNPLLEAAVRDAEQVLERLERIQRENVSETNRLKIETAVQNGRLVLQALSWRADSRFRDRWMAENLRWLREERYPREKLLISAHNVHVCDCDSRMGSFLGEWFGGTVVSIASHAFSGIYAGLDEHTLLPEKIHSIPSRESQDVPSCLRDFGIPAMIVDLREEGLPECLQSTTGGFDLLAFISEVGPTQWLGRQQ